MSAKWLWRVFGTLGLLSTILWTAGFVAGVRDVLYPVAEEDLGFAAVQATPVPNLGKDGVLKITAYGDSLTKGTGDETVKGYVGTLKEMLAEQTGQDVRVSNVAVNGYTSVQLLTDLRDHPGTRAIAREADVIVFTIGGNDIYRPGRDDIDPRLYDERSGEAIDRLKQIMSILSETNPQSQIIYLGLYNPFALSEERQAFDQQIADWNFKASMHAATLPNVMVVPTADLFKRNIKTYLSADEYHPNNKGYQRMAARVAQVLD